MRSLVMGKACPEATKSYVKKSGLPLFHVFDRTKLVSSPIIQGAFHDWDDSIDQETILEVMKHSISNKINSFVVYTHYPHSTHTYAMPHMKDLIQANLIKRDEIVAIADLGVVSKDEDIRRRLEEARKLTNLEHIDLAYIQVCGV
ncbi:hypothetical protein EON63_13065 [archaeon]|nr:MAG: hypothetical protein EON63_13065 [archaeon]